jgi:hypothetical protein
MRRVFIRCHVKLHCSDVGALGCHFDERELVGGIGGVFAKQSRVPVVSGNKGISIALGQSTIREKGNKTSNYFKLCRIERTLVAYLHGMTMVNELLSCAVRMATIQLYL